MKKARIERSSRTFVLEGLDNSKNDEAIEKLSRQARGIGFRTAKKRFLANRSSAVISWGAACGFDVIEKSGRDIFFFKRTVTNYSMTRPTGRHLGKLRAELAVVCFFYLNSRGLASPCTNLVWTPVRKFYVSMKPLQEVPLIFGTIPILYCSFRNRISNLKANLL